MLSRMSLMLVLLSSALPARAELLTLPEAERRALASDATRGATAKIAQVDAELDAVRSDRHPIVNFNTEASAAPGGRLVEMEAVDGQRFLVPGSRRLGDSGAFTTVPRFGGLVSMQANLFDFGRSSSRIRAAEHRARSTRTEEQASRADLVRAVREAYLTWTVAHARVSLAERHLEQGRARFEMIKSWIAEGTRPTADLNVAQQDEISLELELADTRGLLDRARLGIEQLAGGSWPKSAVPDLGLLDMAAGDVPADTAAPLGSAALEEAADAATAQADSVSHDHAPVISTSAEVGVRGQSTVVFPAYRVGVMVTVPLWDGGIGAARARAARAQSDALRAEAAAARKGREDERQLARIDLERSREKLRLVEQLRLLAQQNLDQAGEWYRLGAVDLWVVVDARERLSRAEARELTAKADRTGAWLRAGYSVRPSE